ncbi:MAG: DUF4169 domain-containing protein [Pseudomonadota bacterium]
MSKITSLRRYKKAKARDEKRAKRPLARSDAARDLARARNAKEAAKLEGHKRAPAKDGSDSDD